LSLSILLDQNIPAAIGDYLRSQRSQWTVRHVRDIGLSGASDSTIFQWAQQNSTIVITFGEDFADTRMYPIGGHAGVIRLRVWPTTVEGHGSRSWPLTKHDTGRGFAGQPDHH
jgi:predicted nuclease of predicted toxin-antitoxin system